MPSIRIGLGTDFSLTSELVGIGSTSPSDRLDVRGLVRADNSAGGGGVSTVTRYDGFLSRTQGIADNISIGQTTKGNLNSLSGEIIIPSGKEITVSAGTSIAAGRLDSLTVTASFDLPHGGTAQRDKTPEKGTTRFNEDLGTIEFYTGVDWRPVGAFDGSGRGRGVFAGGYKTPGFSQVIDYVTISSTGNAIDFGQLPNTYAANCGFADRTRGVFFGGYKSGYGTAGNQEIHYITIASQGNSISFGNLNSTTNWGKAGASSSTRGLAMGGFGSTNSIDYIQIQTLGNALDFGDLTTSGFGAAGMSSPTRALCIGHGANRIDAITISSTGNAVTFASIDANLSYTGGGSNSIKGVFNKGGSTTKLQSVIISTFGSVVNFGDMNFTTTSDYAGGNGNTSNNTRLLFAGKGSTAVNTNAIDFVLFASSGNAQDFGDLTQSRGYSGACSDSHGGLGGF